jgi:hypothetical protein
MLRTTVGVSFLVLFGVLSACSSKATDNDNGGGNGAVVGGSGGSAGGSSAGGSSAGGSSAGGSSAGGSSAGTNANAMGGSNGGRAGATSTAGTSSDLCPDKTITCVDDAQAMGCNPSTGSVETIDCAEYYATLGLTSTGCSVSAEGVGCDVTGFKDEACLAGAEAYGVCAQASEEEAVSVYIDCFQDYMGAHTVVTCLGNYVSPTMMTDADCQNAVDACLDEAGGAGGGGP